MYAMYIATSLWTTRLTSVACVPMALRCNRGYPANEAIAYTVK